MKMKTILAGLAGLLLTACTEDLVEQKPSVTSSNSLRVEVIDNLAITRANYSGFPATTFEENDAIGVYAFDGSSYVVSNVRFVKQSDGSWTPDEEVPYNEDYTYYAYFPYRSTVYSPSTSGTVDDIDTKFGSFISDPSNYFWQANQSTKAGFTNSNLMIAKGMATAADKETATVKFTMAHKRGLAIVAAANKWYYSDAAGTKYTATPVFNGTDVPYDEGGTLYYLVKPDVNTSAFGLTINLSAGEYKSCPIKLTGTPTYTYYVNGSASASAKPAWLTVSENVVEGKPTEFEVSSTPASASSYRTYSDSDNTAETAALKANPTASDVDLSMVNNDGSARADGRTTANCYMVHAPGTYKIPLVYGNAIKHGSTNRNAYYTTQTTNTLQYFQNHLGDYIYTENDETDPWIKNHSITVAGAKLVWQDVQGMISSVGISGDYLTFTVDPDNIAPGNAVIAATTGENGTGTVIWSWHIWVTTETLSNLTTIATGDHTYQLAPVNVGWVLSTVRTYTGNTCRVQATNNGVTLTFDVTQADSSAPVNGYNPYYQWGRRDPFLPSTESENTDHAGYTIDGTYNFTYITSSTFLFIALRWPERFYCGNDTYGPYRETYYNFWDAENTSGSNNRAVATVKTVYDPCPPDFCVPTSNCFYYMGKEKTYMISKSGLYGRWWTKDGVDIFFPYTGIRSSNNILDYVRTKGYCWTATPYNTQSGYGFQFETGLYPSIGVSIQNRYSGLSVRAVTEE
jgi:hypothetical protein